MKKKILIAVFCSLAALLLAVVYLFYVSFNGSLIRRIITTQQAKSYVAEYYTGQNLQVDFCEYDFKACGYFCDVNSKESADGNFTVFLNSDGSLRDDYDIRITKRANVISRYSRELDDYIDAIFAEKFKQRTTLVLVYFQELSDEDRAAFLPDSKMNPLHLPAKVHLLVWVETQNDRPTWQEMAERAVELEQLSREILPDTNMISITVQSKLDADGLSTNSALDLSAFDIPCEVIRGDGLEAFLEKARLQQEAEQKEFEELKNSETENAIDS